MVFDLNTANNLPQSSTSSCTDYFYDGCYSKSQNNCHIQYQNCQCRPCCINSVINDHTYSLLKKICRKVFRDYNRQKNREKYTIFEGGNSVNVRIHRSSIGEDGKGKSLHADSSLLTIGGTRRKYGRDRKDDSISENVGKSAGVRKNGEKGKFRKSDETFDTKRDRKIRGQDHEDEKYGKGRKGKEKGKIRGYDDDSDDTKRREKGRKKGEDDDNYGDRKRKKGKGKQQEDGDKRSADQSGKVTSGKKKYGVSGEGDRKDGDSLDEKINRKKSEKNKKNRGSEDNDYDSSRNTGKLSKRKSKKHDDDEENKSGTKERKNKPRGSNEDKKGIKDSHSGIVRDAISREEGKDSRDRDYQSNASKDGRNKGDRYDSARDVQNAGKSSRDRGFQNKEDGNKGYWFNNQKGENKGGRERGQQDRVSKDMRYKGNQYSSTRDDYNESKGGGYRNNQMKGAKDGKHGNDRYSSARNNYDADRKSTIRERKDVADLPVISDLRSKVRKGHDVIPFRIGQSRYRASTFKEGGSKRKTGKHGIKQLTKGSKERINERFGTKRRRKSRADKALRAHFGKYRGYGIGTSSRCDEIRPCDILRAHMEQRELCERQRSCCLQCSCDCSAVYCPAPSTICSRLC